MMYELQLQWESTHRELEALEKQIKQIKQASYEAQREKSDLVMELLRMDSKIELLEIEQETRNFAVASGSPVADQEIGKLRSQLVAALQREEDLE